MGELARVVLLPGDAGVVVEDLEPAEVPAPALVAVPHQALVTHLQYSTVQYSTVQYTRLTRYNLHGFVEDLPRLNIQRYNSGCSHYNSDGKKVESII